MLPSQSIQAPWGQPHVGSWSGGPDTHVERCVRPGDRAIKDPEMQRLKSTKLFTLNKSDS